MKLATKPILHYPSHPRHVAILPWEIYCRYSADMKENANKVHFKCTDFDSFTLVTVYAECIYVFLLKSCPRRWIPCWLLTNTAATSAVTNFQSHKLMAKVNEWKNRDMKKLFAISMWKTCYFIHRKYQTLWMNNKVRGGIMQFVCIFFHICWISADIINFSR